MDQVKETPRCPNCPFSSGIKIEVVMKPVDWQAAAPDLIAGISRAVSQVLRASR